ncbi:class I adenylate-forming enzyme family protein [Dyella sp. KRB-257]|uniref:class I adenylate-forming enzyme family protein n=1 Tax=Dyella sp. KRB-257 TaxID=3400915 RepID=UPI003C0F94EE
MNPVRLVRLKSAGSRWPSRRLRLERDADARHGRWVRHPHASMAAYRFTPAFFENRSVSGKPMDIGQLLRRQSERRPQHPALIHQDRVVDFRELDRRVESVRRQLLERGIRQGTPVGIILPNCLEFAYLYLALMRMGAIAAPMDVRLGAPELSDLLAHCAIRHAFAAADFVHAQSLPASVQLIPTSALVLDQPPPDAPPAPIDPQATALYLHTSGTTGLPKVVELSFANLDCFPQAMTMLGTGADEVLAMVLPMSHISGPILLNEMLDKGSSLVIIDRLSGAHLLEAIERYRISFIHAVPPIFQMMLAAEPETYDLSSLRVAAMMGTSVPLAVMQAFKARLPHVKVLQGYGLTETSPLLTLTPPAQADGHLDSIGRAVPMGEVFIADGQGRPLRPGQVGEIVARGPMVMKGYLNNPQATAARIHNGLLHTGDAGKQDADGFFYHLGRLDDQIVTGRGLNVYPAEVENALLLHPAVMDAAVVGIQDAAEQGQIVVAYVIARDPVPSVTELRRHCLKHLAAYEVPKRFVFVSELPRNATGKVVRERLRQTG